MKRKKYDFDINENSRHRHAYLFVMPLVLYRKVKIMAENEGVSLRSMLITLLKEGIKATGMTE